MHRARSVGWECGAGTLARTQVQIDDQSSALGLGRPDAHDCTLAGYGIFVDLAAFYGLCWSSVYGANRN